MRYLLKISILFFLTVFPGLALSDDILLNLSSTDGSTAVSIRNGDGKEISRIDSKGRISDCSGQLIPVGSILAFAVASPPAGWLECDGSAVSRQVYAELFAEIGETYGSGDGNTTFNLPDYRGYFLRAWDNGAGVDPEAARRADRGDGVSGDHLGTKQDDSLRAHSHQLEWTPSRSRSSYRNYYTYEESLRRYPRSGLHTREAGGMETRPRNISVMYCIKH